MVVALHEAAWRRVVAASSALRSFIGPPSTERSETPREQSTATVADPSANVTEIKLSLDPDVARAPGLRPARLERPSDHRH